MKTLIYSTAMLIGVAAAAPASAQIVTVTPPGYSGPVDDANCRVVEKRVKKNNKTVITKQRRCGDAAFRNGDGGRYVERSGPGINLNIR
jgi:hypothetical protein